MTWTVKLHVKVTSQALQRRPNLICLFDKKIIKKNPQTMNNKIWDSCPSWYFFPSLGFCHARFSQSTYSLPPQAPRTRLNQRHLWFVASPGAAKQLTEVLLAASKKSEKLLSHCHCDATATLPSPAMSASSYDSYGAFKCQTCPSYLVREGCVEAHQWKLMQPGLHGCAVQSLLPWSWSKYSKSCNDPVRS